MEYKNLNFRQSLVQSWFVLEYCIKNVYDRYEKKCKSNRVNLQKPKDMKEKIDLLKNQGLLDDGNCNKMQAVRKIRIEN